MSAGDGIDEVVFGDGLEEDGLGADVVAAAWAATVV